MQASQLLQRIFDTLDTAVRELQLGLQAGSSAHAYSPLRELILSSFRKFRVIALLTNRLA
jgi:hypothetical protein